MEKIEFTKQEERILGRSGDFAVVGRYRSSAIVVALIFSGLLLALAFLSGSMMLVLIFSLSYILITLVEKLAYARAIAGYKHVIVKLSKRVQQLNGSTKE